MLFVLFPLLIEHEVRKPFEPSNPTVTPLSLTLAPILYPCWVASLVSVTFPFFSDLVDTLVVVVFL